MTATVTNPAASAFRQTAEGPTIDLGTHRWVPYWLVGFALTAACALGFYLWVNAYVLPTMTPVTRPLLYAFETPVVMFLAFAVSLAAAVALRAGRWSVSASESGIRVARGHRLPREIPWAHMRRIRIGAVAVKVSRYRTDLAEGIWIEVRGGRTVRFDTARYRVRAEDVDAMAAAIRDVAARHGAAVEPFPMMGRDRF